jgi:predicted nucleic acid-binding protein
LWPCQSKKDGSVTDVLARCERVVLRALELYDLYPQFDVEDALSLATMQQSGLTEIVSYDRDFNNVPGITREEP